jgi:hypothetical protein
VSAGGNEAGVVEHERAALLPRRRSRASGGHHIGAPPLEPSPAGPATTSGAPAAPATTTPPTTAEAASEPFWPAASTLIAAVLAVLAIAALSLVVILN